MAKPPTPEELMAFMKRGPNLNLKTYYLEGTPREVEVSTIELPFDHSFSRNGPAQLYETLIQGGIHDDRMYRYATRDEAIAGHQAACKKVQESLEPPIILFNKNEGDSNASD